MKVIITINGKGDLAGMIYNNVLAENGEHVDSRYGLSTCQDNMVQYNIRNNTGNFVNWPVMTDCIYIAETCAGNVIMWSNDSLTGNLVVYIDSRRHALNSDNFVGWVADEIRPLYNQNSSTTWIESWRRDLSPFECT